MYTRGRTVSHTHGSDVTRRIHSYHTAVLIRVKPWVMGILHLLCILNDQAQCIEVDLLNLRFGKVGIATLMNG